MCLTQFHSHCQNGEYDRECVSVCDSTTNVERLVGWFYQNGVQNIIYVAFSEDRRKKNSQAISKAQELKMNIILSVVGNKLNEIVQGIICLVR